MRLRVASFNIYFFGDRSKPAHVVRDDQDLALLARVVADVDGDVIAFQEIHDRELLQLVLDQASALRQERSWTLTVPVGVLATGSKPTSPYQVALAVDRRRVDVTCISTPIKALSGSRRPLIVEAVIDGKYVQIIAVHMKSGLLDDPMTSSNAETRLRETTRLRDWIEAHPVGLRVLIGDLNSLPTHPSLEPLRTLPGWTWPAHRWPDGVRRWTTHLDSFDFDPCAIDHLALGPGLVTEAVDVHCFDRAEEPVRDGLALREWLGSDQRVAPNLQRVSDHRPIFANLELA